MSGDAVIIAAEAVRVRVPFRRPIRTAAGEWTHRESWILRLRDTGGAVGLGEAALDFDRGEDPNAAELSRLFRVMVERVSAGESLPTTAELEASGVPGRALRSALDSAMLDLGLGASAPGAVSRSVPVNATIGFLELSETAAAARNAAAGGFGTIKLKVGPERHTAELVERVAAARTAAGPNMLLRLDANGAWDAATARVRIAAVAPYRIEYVEQPIAAGDAHSLAEVRVASPIPIAADESVSSAGAARDLLAARAVDVLVVKPARIGGPVPTWEIAAMAAAAGVHVVISTLFETGVGLAAALATAASLPVVAGATHDYAHGLATADLLESDLLTHPLSVVDGRMQVPDGPGLCISLDDAALERYAVEWLGRRP